MAKRKRQRRPPQARHAEKSAPSRHDKRKRLGNANPQRKKTTRAIVPLVGAMASVVASMARILDARSGFRLPIVVAGAMLARGRRTASSWYRAAGVGGDWDCFYDLLNAIGKRVAPLATPLLQIIVQRFDPGPDGYWRIAIDDSPTKRFGPHVEAANVHHNPTPGPVDGEFMYGHNWVCLAFLAKHPSFGVIALTLLSQLYVRKVDIEKLDRRYGWTFQTKHQLALGMVRSVTKGLRALGSRAKVMVIFDGAYTSRDLVRPLVADGATVVSRLRRDAKLYDVPPPPTGKRGRPRLYGRNRLSLAKRAAHREGWNNIRYSCRGVMREGRCKTFEATSSVVGGAIRVVIVEHARGNWAAYYSTDLSQSAAEILQAVSDRWAIEEHFHDVKEIWGAGQQQVRNVWSNIGCWNLCTWLFTLVELDSWNEGMEELVDRGDRPWDNPDRRPSHADRRKRIMRKMLQNEFLKDLPPDLNGTKIRQHFETLLSFAA